MLISLKRIHKDEEGLEVLQVVAILAVAAIILAVIKVFWKEVKDWLWAEKDGTIGKDAGWEKAQ